MSWLGLTVPTDPRFNNISLVAIWAYYCKRCNYVWLPKDFDVSMGQNGVAKGGKDLLDRQPPKCCARCKSRSWQEWPVYGNYDTRGKSQARARALERVRKSSPDYDAKAEAQEDRYLKRLEKQFADNERVGESELYLLGEAKRKEEKEGRTNNSTVVYYSML
jgi:hypothetical protein